MEWWIMTLLIIIILSIVQGATEFLPISSSGHLVLLYKIFGIQDNTLFLSVILHLATLVSVIIYYRKSLLALIRKPLCHTNICIVLTTAVTCVLALICKPYIEATFDGRYLSIGFVITAILLLISQMLAKKISVKSPITHMSISYPKALTIGLTQAIACFPAISRSGTTIATALMCKVDQKEATEYSFLISIPIVIASTMLELAEYIASPTPIGFSVIELIIGFAIALFVGVVSIKLMTNIVAKQKLYYFSFYLLIIALVSAII